MNAEETGEVEAIEDVSVDSFEPGTLVSRMSDGSVQLRLSLMPPAWARHPFDSFRDDLARALGVEVTGLDKELFQVRAPRADTADRIVSFLEALRLRC